MNPGEMPRETEEDAELGEALHQRLSQLAARLERLTGSREAEKKAAGESIAETERAAEIFAMAAEPAAAPPRQNGAGTASSSRPRQEATSLAEIAAALRDLDQKPVERREPARPADQRSAEHKLRAIRQRIDALKARNAEADKKAAEAHAEPKPQAETSAEIEEASATPDAVAPADATTTRRRRTVDFNAAIAEIAERQRLIDESAEAAAGERPPETPPEAEAKPAAIEDGTLTGAIAELRQRVDELSRSAAEAPAPASWPPASDKTEASASPTPSNEASLAPPSPPDEEVEARSLPARESEMTAEPPQSAIMERLDQLLERGPESGVNAIAQEILHRVPSGERFDALSAEIDRLSERIATSDPRPALSRIDERLSSFFEQYPSGGAAALVEVNPRVEAEIAGIRDAVENLSNMLHNGGSPALRRLEERLNQISERFETTLSNAPRADTVTDLLQRLETIAARSETAPAALDALASEIAELRARERSELASLDTHIQTLAQRLDETIAGQSQGGTAVADLESRLASLTRRLDDLAAADPSAERQAELAQVEDQIAQLSTRIDHIDAAEGTPEGLAELERQVATLMSRLELLASDHDTLHRIQDNLARLETTVFDSQSQSLDTIRQAARDAVQELSGLSGSKDSALVEGLKADLRDLQEAAHSNDRQTADTLDTVHETLDRVVARLSNLENEVRGHGTSEPATTAPVQEPASARAQPRPKTQETPRRSEAPAAPDRPIVPGSTRTEPAAKPTGDRDRRADFIAAARRAAQAAAAEHNAIRRAGPDAKAAEAKAESAGALARLGRMISDHRRPLLIAATAVVLAIAVIQIVKPFSGRDAAPAEPPAVTEPATPETDTSPAAAVAPAAETPAAPAEPAASSTAPPAETSAGAAPAETSAGTVPATSAAPSAAAYIPPAGVVSPVVTPETETPAASAEAAPSTPVAAAPAAGDEAAADATPTYPEPDTAVGPARLRVAAAAGDPAALYEVGARYAEGRGVDRDMAEAAVWLERAANAGLAVAQQRLATLYEAGLGVTEDRQTAYDWYLAAAEQGNVLAMHNLGVMLSQGIDGTPDFDGAIEWFTAAADHGIRDSQYNLGVIYARGIGVDPDLVASYKWFALAAAQGDNDAAARRDDVAAALTPEQLATARAAVSAWQIEGAPAEANTVAEPEGGWDAPDDRAELDHQDLVRTIQGLLAQEGYDPGPADGVEGPMTRDAVRAFQQAIGQEPTGVMDENLLDTLANRAG